jgi:hypothetical protein
LGETRRQPAQWWCLDLAVGYASAEHDLAPVQAPSPELFELGEADDRNRTPTGVVDLHHEVGPARQQLGIGAPVEGIEGLFQ